MTEVSSTETTTWSAESTDALDFLSEIDFASSIEALEMALSESAESLTADSLNFDWDSDTASLTEKCNTDYVLSPDATIDLTCTEEICFVTNTHSCVDCQDVKILQPRKKSATGIGFESPITKSISSPNSSATKLSVIPDRTMEERKYHFPSPVDQLWCPGCHKALPVFAKEQDLGEILLFRKRNYGFKGFNASYPSRFELFLKKDGPYMRIAAQRGFCTPRCYKKAERKPIDEHYEWVWTFNQDEFETAYDKPGVRIEIPSYIDKKLTFTQDWFWEPMLFEKSIE